VEGGREGETDRYFLFAENISVISVEEWVHLMDINILEEYPRIVTPCCSTVHRRFGELAYFQVLRVN
jgi:hypothetical protein